MYHTLSASEKISVDLNMLAHIKRLAASRAAVNSRSNVKPQRNGRKAMRDAEIKRKLERENMRLVEKIGVIQTRRPKTPPHRAEFRTPATTLRRMRDAQIGEENADKLAVDAQRADYLATVLAKHPSNKKSRSPSVSTPRSRAPSVTHTPYQTPRPSTSHNVFPSSRPVSRHSHFGPASDGLATVVSPIRTKTGPTPLSLRPADYMMVGKIAPLSATSAMMNVANGSQTERYPRSRPVSRGTTSRPASEYGRARGEPARKSGPSTPRSVLELSDSSSDGEDLKYMRWKAPIAAIQAASAKGSPFLAPQSLHHTQQLQRPSSRGSQHSRASSLFSQDSDNEALSPVVVTRRPVRAASTLPPVMSRSASVQPSTKTPLSPRHNTRTPPPQRPSTPNDTAQIWSAGTSRPNSALSRPSTAGSLFSTDSEDTRKVPARRHVVPHAPPPRARANVIFPHPPISSVPPSRERPLSGRKYAASPRSSSHHPNSSPPHQHTAASSLHALSVRETTSRESLKLPLSEVDVYPVKSYFCSQHGKQVVSRIDEKSRPRCTECGWVMTNMSRESLLDLPAEVPLPSPRRRSPVRVTPRSSKSPARKDVSPPKSREGMSPRRDRSPAAWIPSGASKSAASSR